MSDKDRVRAILADLGIEIEIGGCGCCRSPWFTFVYKGEVIVNNEDDFTFSNLNKEKP